MQRSGHRVLVLGPDSALAPMTVAALVPLAADNEQKSVALAGLLAIVIGGILLLGSVLRLGIVTGLLSKPIRLGYLKRHAACGAGGRARDGN
jgi:sulfate permease, SulP family